jgi:hypothetical protein
MARQRRDEHPRSPLAKAILTPLITIERSTSRRPEDIWDHWLQRCEAIFLGSARASHDGTPPHAMAALPEVRAVDATLRPRYGDAWERVASGFDAAFTALCAASQGDITEDVLGSLYMGWVIGNRATGQFFTPFEVSLFLAQLHDVGAQVQARVDAAVQAHPELTACTLAMLGCDDAEAICVARARLRSAIRAAVAPVTVCDPACGSGGMLLAVAATLPRWMCALGLVEFYGIDIDETCVRMARVNLLRYGIAPWGIRHGDALTGEFFDAPTLSLPAPAPAPDQPDEADTLPIAA